MRSTEPRSDRRVRTAAAALVAVGTGIGVIWPLVAVLLRSSRPFAGRSGLSAEGAAEVLGDGRTREVLAETLLQAGWSTVACLVVGVPLAWGLARGRVPARGALEVLLTVPFVLPSLVVAAAVLEVSDLVGERGDRPLLLVVLAHALFDVGLVARLVAPALEGGVARTEPVARVLGRSRRRAALVTLRLALPTIGAAGVLVFLMALTSFGVVLALGGDAVSTLEVEVWVRATRLLDLPGAAVLAALQGALGVGVLLAIGRLRPPGLGGRIGPSGGGRAGPVALATWVAALAVVAVPLTLLVVGSLQRGGHWTVDNYRDLVTARLPGGGPTLVATILRSLGFAAVAAAVAALLGGAAAIAGGRWRALAVLPIGTSAAVLGLGWLLAFGGTPDLRGTAAIVVGAQVVVALPLVVQAVGPALDRVDRRRGEVARVAGASALRRWSAVIGPTVLPAAAVGIGFAFTAALGDVGAVSFVAVDDQATAPLALARLLSRPGAASSGRALALAVVLAASAASVVAITSCVGRLGERPVR